MLRLAIHRDMLASRNSHIPALLPAVWAQMGFGDRADALARGFGDDHKRAMALAHLAAAQAASGLTDSALHLVQEAEAIGKSAPNDSRRAKLASRLSVVAEVAGDLSLSKRLRSEAVASQVTGTLGLLGVNGVSPMKVAEEAARAGDFEKADDLVGRSTVDQGQRDRARLSLAGIALDRRDYESAHTLSSKIAGREFREQADVMQAQALAGRGDFAEAERRAEAIPTLTRKAQVYVRMVGPILQKGDRDRALRMALQAEKVIADIDPRSRPELLSELVRAAAPLDGGALARRLWDRIETRADQAEVMAHVAQQMVADRTGTQDQIVALLLEAEEIARGSDDRDERALIVCGLVAALGDIGDYELAADAARLLPEYPTPTRTPGVVATVEAIARAGSCPGAYAVADAIPDLGERVRAIVAIMRVAGASDTDRAWAKGVLPGLLLWQRGRALAALVEGAAAAGHCLEAERLAPAGAVDEPYGVDRIDAAALLTVGRAWLNAGDRLRAAKAVHQVLDVGAVAVGDGRQTELRLDIASLLASAGELESAVDIIKAADFGSGDESVELVFNARKHALLADAHARAGRFDEAMAIAGPIAHPAWRDVAMSNIGRSAAAEGDWTRSSSTIDLITSPTVRAEALVAQCEAMIERGELSRATELTRRIPVAHLQFEAMFAVAQALIISDPTASASLAFEAVDVAAQISDADVFARTVVEALRMAARAGGTEAATWIARSLTDPWTQALSLAAVAESCDPVQAAPLVAGALVAGHWALSIAAVGRVDRALLIDAAARYLADARHVLAGPIRTP